MTKNTLIGLTGRAGAGKDSIATVLRNYHGLRPVALADPIRDMLAEMLWHFHIRPHWHDRQWRETPLDGIGKTPRELMQTIGTEWGRNLVAQDLWLRVIDRKIQQQELDGGSFGIVVTDIRFENEAAFIRSRGGRIWHIERPGSAERAGIANHASESGILFRAGDLKVVNRHRLEDLPDLVARALLG